MPDLVHFEVYPQVIEGPHMIPLYHRTQGMKEVMSNDADAIRDLMQQGFTRAYQHQEFPKAMHHTDGRVKVVKDAAEQGKLGKGWSEKPFKRPSWDVRQPEPLGINEHHLAFMQHHGFAVATVEEAKEYFGKLSDGAQEDFLRDASEWIPPEPEKRKPGRPKNPEPQPAV